MADKISLAGWSLNRRFRREQDPLRLVDYPSVAKEEFGIEAVELNNPFFASTEDAYLDELVEAAKRAGVVFTGMAVDGTGNPAALDEDERKASIEQIRPWFRISKRLGLPAFRVNTGGTEPKTTPGPWSSASRASRNWSKKPRPRA